MINVNRILSYPRRDVELRLRVRKKCREKITWAHIVVDRKYTYVYIPFFDILLICIGATDQIFSLTWVNKNVSYYRFRKKYKIIRKTFMLYSNYCGLRIIATCLHVYTMKIYINIMVDIIIYNYNSCIRYTHNVTWIYFKNWVYNF
jgi:hypothetical protein